MSMSNRQIYIYMCVYKSCRFSFLKAWGNWFTLLLQNVHICARANIHVAINMHTLQEITLHIITIHYTTIYNFTKHNMTLHCIKLSYIGSLPNHAYHTYNTYHAYLELPVFDLRLGGRVRGKVLFFLLVGGSLTWSDTNFPFRGTFQGAAKLL